MSRIRTNFITNRMANGAPTVSNGLVISGVTTCNATANQPLVLNNTNTNGQSSIAFQSAGANKFIVGSNKDSDGNIDFFVYDDVNNKHRFNIDASGKVGINSSVPSSALEIYTAASAAWKFRIDTTVSDGAGFYQRANGDFEVILRDASNNNNFISGNGGGLEFATSGTEKVRITSSGKLLVGTTTPGYNDLDDLTIATSGNTGITIRSGTSSLGVIGFADGTSGNAQYRGVIQYSHSGDFMQFNTADAERFRITSDGRLLLGTNTTTNNIRVGNKFGIVGTAAYTGMSISQYAGATGNHKPMIDFNRSRGTSDQSMTSVAENDGLGEIIFRGADGNSFEDGAAIRAFVDGTPGNSDMPGRLTFHTSGDGTTTLTERVRINKDGYVTAPYQPSFNVTITTVGQINSNVGVIIFNNTTSLGNHNVGNHYNTSNGRFTAPVAGRYQFNARMLTNSSTQSYTIYLLRVNANHVGYIGHNHSDYWFMESGSFVLNLQANDYVDCYLQQHSGHGGHNYASFSGFLIG